MNMRFIIPVLLTVLSPVFAAERVLPIGLKGPGADYESEVPEGFQRLALGDAPPDFNLIGVDDKFHTLSEYKGGKILMVVFLSNHCPYSHAQEARIIPLINKLKPMGLKVVAIQPNTPLPEYATGLAYSKYNDTFEEMKLYAKENKFTFDYLYDGDTQETSKAFGALATPHVYLFDENLKLRYAGRFDDGRFEEAESVTNHATRDALDAMMAGKPVAVPFTKPYGCSVKWTTPDEKAMAGYKSKWKHEPITMGTIDAAGVAALAKNPTQKLRLFNVWSSTGINSVEKLGEFSALAQRLDRRDFEVITISLDTAAGQETALKHLQDAHVGMPTRIKESIEKEGRATNNFRYSGKMAADVAKALDPKWPGAPLPHTVLIAPGGEVLWRYTGAGFDPVPLRRLILDRLGVMFENDGRYTEAKKGSSKAK